MPQWVLDKKDFLKGIAVSSEIGGFFLNTSGYDPYNSDEKGTVSGFNAVGALRPGYSLTDFGGVDVWDLIEQMVVGIDNTTTLNTVYLYGFDNSGRAYRVNTGTDAAPVTLATAAGFNRGATIYDNGTDTRLYVAGSTAVADISDPFAATMSTFNNPTGGSPPTLTAGRPHPMYVKNGVLWVADSNNLYALDRSRTWRSGTQLEIPPLYIIHSISEYDIYLALGAPSFYAAPGSIASTQLQSRIFLWDMKSFRFNFEYLVAGTLVQLINADGVLHALTVVDGGFILYRFTGNSFEPLIKRSNAGLALSMPSGRPLLDYDRGRFYWLMADTELENRFDMSDQQSLFEIHAYGSQFNVPNVYHKPYQALKTTSSIDAGNIGALKVGKQNKLYVSFFNGITAGFKLGVFKSGSESNAHADTVSLSSYFNDTGALKKLNFIRYEFDPLASGDTTACFIAYDYETTFGRLDGADDAASLNSISFADIGAENAKTFRSFDQRQFRDLRLGLSPRGGDVRIRRIVVDWKPVNDAGDY